MLKFLIVLISFFSTIACSQEFMSVVDDQIYVDNHSFNFSGTNQYYLFYKSQKMVDSFFEDAKKLKLNVVRTWGFCDGTYKDGYSFQPKPGLYDEATFRKMDYTIWKAGQSKIKLVIPLVNNWDDMGGMMQYVRWAGANEHDDFYSNSWIKQTYKNYVTYFLNRTNTITGIQYKNDPTIAIWELANEPRYQSNKDKKIFQDWVDEMSAFIKSIDKNHLVSIGDEGFLADNPSGDWPHNGSQGNDWIKNNSLKNIDIATFHLYPDHWGFNEEQSRNWISEHINKARDVLNKPVYLGEFGLRDRGNRDRIYRDWYDLAINNKMSGILFWLLSSRQDDGSRYPDFDGFTVYIEDSTTSLIKEKTDTIVGKVVEEN